MINESDVQHLSSTVRKCRACVEDLPLGARPIFQINPAARILIASQAPGRIAHVSGIPFQDASGKRLRQWMGISSADFYDVSKIAIVPIGLCYPGKGSFGDKPPLSACAPLWRKTLLSALPNIILILAIGRYAQQWHLPESNKSIAQRVRLWEQMDGHIIPLPHPSPVNNRWLSQNSWFATSVLPKLKQKVTESLR